MQTLLPVGTRVRHNYNTGHGAGVIVAYNHAQPNTYAAENLQVAAEIAAAGGLGQALVNSMYDGARYPYVVLYDSGYKDVYSVDDVVPFKG